MKDPLCTQAHCVSEWGHDFRPDYRQLDRCRAALPGLPIMALTATAVPRVQEDIMRCLALTAPYVAKSSFDRQNLAISVTRSMSGEKVTALKPLIEQLKQNSGSTIVYCATQREVEDIAKLLQEHTPPAPLYPCCACIQLTTNDHRIGSQPPSKYRHTLAPWTMEHGGTPIWSFSAVPPR